MQDLEPDGDHCTKATVEDVYEAANLPGPDNANTPVGRRLLRQLRKFTA